MTVKEDGDSLPTRSLKKGADATVVAKKRGVLTQRVGTAALQEAQHQGSGCLISVLQMFSLYHFFALKLFMQCPLPVLVPCCCTLFSKSAQRTLTAAPLCWRKSSRHLRSPAGVVRQGSAVVACASCSWRWDLPGSALACSSRIGYSGMSALLIPLSMAYHMIRSLLSLIFFDFHLAHMKSKIIAVSAVQQGISCTYIYHFLQILFLLGSYRILSRVSFSLVLSAIYFIQV